MSRNEPVIPAPLADALRRARHVVVLTGAGISAESGVPTFRDAQTGLWARYRPEELATPEAFRRDPQLIWNWYRWRKELASGAVPNAGHRALVEMEPHVPHLTLITQNVDGLHRRAGSRRIVELHGSLERARCFERSHPAAWPPESEELPRCSLCGSPLRPDVVWFGEMLPQEALEAAIAAASK
jgi:NAD-dependent deacetylase